MAFQGVAKFQSPTVQPVDTEESAVVLDVPGTEAAVMHGAAVAAHRPTEAALVAVPAA